MAWTLRSLLEKAGVDASVRGEAPVTGLAYDTRTVTAGELFCCIPGAKADGHSFAGEAMARGATCLLVERWLQVAAPQARVERVREALGPVAAAFFGRPSEEMPVAAVTGTNGKTTVTYLLESIARAAGREPGVIGTVSRRFKDISEAAVRNTPEAIDLHFLLRRMRDAGVDLVVIEATSDGLSQGRLRATSIAVAGFTNLTQDHLNTHGSMEQYFEAKALLFDTSYTSRAVINVSDAYGRRLHERVRAKLDVITYGDATADISCEHADVTPSGSRARFRTPAGVWDIQTPLVGRYNLDNCMCACGLALLLELAPEDVVEGMRRLAKVSGRLEPIDAGQPFLALVDYAHTPDGLRQALAACREITSGRVIVAFGCGGDRDRAKRPLMGEEATRAADLSIITSDNPRSEDPLRIIAEIEVGAERGGGEFVVVPDRREAIAAALREAGPGDVVLVAGKGHEQGQEFADAAIPFDDRDVVADLLGEVACRS